MRGREHGVRTGWAARTGARLALALLVGLAWVAMHAAFTLVFPDGADGARAYRYRDDALITLSHARGLVEVGTVSVGVTGARVEGFSAPLQFAMAVIYYAAGGTGYRRFLDAQVWMATMLLGSAFFVMLRVAAPQRPLRVTALVAAAVAAPLFATYPFFGWHSSGMENALTNMLAATAVAALALGTREIRVLPIASVAVAALALSRQEFAFHAVPLLAVASVWLVLRGGGWRGVALVVGPAAVLWAGVQVGRMSYFGTLLPNTAYVQRISPLRAAWGWAAVLWPLAAPIGYLAARVWRGGLGLRGVARSPAFWIVSAIGVLGVGYLARYAGHGVRANVAALDGAARVLGGAWWVLLVLGLALLVRVRVGIVELLLTTLAVTGICHLLVFGPARLAGERVVTFVLVPLAGLAATLLLQFDPGRAFGVAGPVGATVVRLAGAAALMGVALVAAWGGRTAWNSERPLCCDMSKTVRRILAEASSVARQTALPVVSVANADLGLLSLRKQVNVTDLGLLGDPLLARVVRRARDAGRIDVAIDYLNRYAAPDVVELHGTWSCVYAPWGSSDGFRDQYHQVWDDGWTRSWGRSRCPGRGDVGGGIWVRRDLLAGVPSREVTLSRALAADPDPARVRRELASCPTTDAWSCQYVTRSVLRNLRRFEAAGRLGDVRAAFQASPSARYDMAVLSSRDRGDWYLPAADALLAGIGETPSSRGAEARVEPLHQGPGRGRLNALSIRDPAERRRDVEP
jgi:hypothetical protein